MRSSRILGLLLLGCLVLGIFYGKSRGKGPHDRGPGSLPTSDALSDPIEPSVVSGRRTEAELLQEDNPESIRQLPAGTTHLYRLELAADHLLTVEVDQLSRDVISRLLDPEGRELIQVDSRSQDRGTEVLEVLIAQSGPHTLRIRAFDGGAPSGAYRVRIATWPASTRDRRHAEAAKAFAEAFALNADAPPDTVQQRAVEGFQKAADLWKELGKLQRRAEALFELGFLYNDAEDKARALDCFQQILPFYEGKDRAAILNGIGLGHQEARAPELARQSFEKALHLFRELGDARNEETVRHNLARLDIRQGRLVETVTSLEDTLERLLQRRGGVDRLAETHNALGEAYLLLGKPDFAVDHHRRALQLLDLRRFPLLHANTMSFLAYAYFKGGDLERAGKLYSECLTLRREAGAPAVHVARTLSGLGVVATSRGNPKEALEHFRQALESFQGEGALLDQAVVLGNIARIHNDLGRPARALDLHRRAAELFRPLAYLKGEASSLYGIAVAQRHQGQHTEALDNAEEALALIERIVESGQVSARRGDLIPNLFADKHAYFDFYIDLLMEQHRDRPEAGYDALALATSEQARARHLLEILAENPSVFRQGVRQHLLDEERELREAINTIDRKFRQRTGASDRRGESQDEARQRGLWTRYNRLIQQIREESSWHSSLHQPRPLALAGIQELLDEQTLLLEYHLGERQSFLWAVGRGSLRSYELPPRVELEELARRTHRELTESDHINILVPVERDLRILRRLLLDPVADQIAGKRLLIVASGALATIPFAALPVPGFPEHRLVEDHEIVYVPSASVLAMLKHRERGRRPATGKLAILADAVYDPADPRLPVRHDPAPATVGRLGRIPHSGHEAREILRIASGHGEGFSAFGLDASRDLVESGRLADYQILHFAAHGVLGTDQPNSSALVLSRYDESGEPVASALSTKDIHMLDLSAELVVLSACESALGPQIRGEGMMGLPRAFLYSGARQVLASLWQVHDEGTAELMSRFYRHLLVEGATPAVALQKAQRSMAADRRYSPYHWAGFVLQGQPAPLSQLSE